MGEVECRYGIPSAETRMKAQIHQYLQQQHGLIILIKLFLIVDENGSDRSNSTADILGGSNGSASTEIS